MMLQSVTSAGRDAWKVRCGTSLLDYTKLKKGTEPYMLRIDTTAAPCRHVTRA